MKNKKTKPADCSKCRKRKNCDSDPSVTHCNGYSGEKITREKMMTYNKIVAHNN